MIAIDTNLLVFAHRRDSPHHERAAACVKDLAEGVAPWAIPWPCVHEFFAIVTHPRIYDPPSTCQQALSQIESWLEAPHLLLLAEGGLYWRRLRDLLSAGHVAGPRVHDARIAALCIENRVTTLLTFDRDFSRFPALTTRNPLVG